MIKAEYGNTDIKGTKPNNDDFACKLFIGGLSTVTTEDSMRLFYEQWGQVVDAVVLRDPTTKRSRGFGFITYANPSMVDKAQSARPHILDGKNVDSKRALPRPELLRSEVKEVKKIFVGGLKDNHDEESLREHFSQFGNVVDVKILLDKATNRKRGFAFVEFDDYDAVDKAVLHKNHTIRYVLVDVKKSVYKQELAKKMAVQQANGMMHPNALPVSGAQLGYQQPIGGYNGQAAFASGYPAQLQQPYNNWNSYAQPGAPAQAVYQQPPPSGNFGQYQTAQQNGSVPWNGSTSYTPAWPQNGGYIGPQPTSGNQAVGGGNGGWNNPGQNFGDYQQTYNGGPQKVTNLQGNRMNPYNVAAANFGI